MSKDTKENKEQQKCFDMYFKTAFHTWFSGTYPEKSANIKQHVVTLAAKKMWNDLEEEKRKNGSIKDHEGNDFNFSSTTTATEGSRKWGAFLKQRATMAEIIKVRGPAYIEEISTLSNGPLAVEKKNHPTKHQPK